MVGSTRQVMHAPVSLFPASSLFNHMTPPTLLRPPLPFRAPLHSLDCFPLAFFFLHIVSYAQFTTHTHSYTTQEGGRPPCPLPPRDIQPGRHPTQASSVVTRDL